MLNNVKQGFGWTVGHVAGMLAVGIVMKAIEKYIDKVEKKETDDKNN